MAMPLKNPPTIFKLSERILPSLGLDAEEGILVEVTLRKFGSSRARTPQLLFSEQKEILKSMAV